jgi:DNA-binding MarR family transcriptional regulator
MVSLETKRLRRAAAAAARGPSLELERFLPYRLSVLSNTVSRAIAQTYERRFALSVTEWRVMAVLGRYDGLSARAVAERTAMDKVAVSRALARLIDAGRVRRMVANHDRRQSVLRLSARGWKVYAQVAPLALEHERRLLAHLDRSEREWLGRILDKLWQAELEERGYLVFGIWVWGFGGAPARQAAAPMPQQTVAAAESRIP